MGGKDIEPEFNEYGEISKDIRQQVKSSEPFGSSSLPSRSPIPTNRSSGVSSLLVTILVVGIIGVIGIGVIGFFVFKQLQKPAVSVTLPPNIVESASTSPAFEPVIQPTAVAQPVQNDPVPATAEIRTQNTPRSATQSPTWTPQAISSWIFEQKSVGKSVQRRDLSMTVIGYKGGMPVVVIGSIQGDQSSTRTLVDALINYYRQDEDRVPNGVTFYLIPSINPDGNTSDSRYNANGVDLNRNWDTDDWKSKAAVPGYPNGKAGAGGSYPFSEPETIALRDLLNNLKASSSSLRVVTLHASVQRSSGEVYPGGHNATRMAEAYANAANYDIEYEWDQYTTSGEAVTWCDEQGIPSIDIVVPASQSPSSRVYGNLTLLDVTVKGLEAISR